MPLSWLYGALARRQRRQAVPRRAPVPLLVVGNLVVGGAGKTPTVIAVVAELQAAGHRPGIVSRGHGRRDDGVHEVQAGDAPALAGDEPLLLRRRCAVPVWVGRDRAAVATALCNRHPDVDVIVSDDGLQHHTLARDAALVVFDERGAGNGLLLPAGPLREPLPATLPAGMQVLYTAGQASTPLPGALAQRRITHAWPLQAWHAGRSEGAVPLATLNGPMWAAAGLAAPEKFFGMLRAAGLSFHALPLPDHHAWTTLPWPASTPDVLVTEKDAVKLDPVRMGTTRVWVVPLDLQLPVGLVSDLIVLLFPRTAT